MKYLQYPAALVRRHPLTLKLATLALVVGTALGGLWWATVDRIAFEAQEVQADEFERNDRLALAHEQQARLVLRAFDEALLSITGDPARVARLLSGAEALPDSLALRGMAVGLADAQGRPAGPGLGLPAGWVQALADHHRQADPRQAFVQVPVRVPGTPRWVTTLSRPLRDAQGRFLGVAYARLDPQAFLDFFQQARLGASDVILVIGQDGIARARRAGAAYSYAEPQPGSQLARQAAQSPSGHFLTASPVDGERRFYSFRTLPEYGLAAAVGTSHASVMEPVRERAHRYQAMAGVASLALVAGAIALGLAIRRHDRDAARLRRSEQRFRSLTQMSADWFWETDTEHRLRLLVRAPRYDNHHLEHSLGSRRWEIEGLEAVGGWPVHRGCLNEHRPFVDLELRWRDPLGRMRYSLVSGEPLFDDGGRFDGYRGVGRDVTAQRQAQAAREASEARLAGIIESAMDAIITVDAQQRIVVFNAAAAQMFRCPPGQALGQPLDQLLPERFRAAHGGHMRHFAGTHATPRNMGRGSHIWALRADGQEFPADASISQVEIDGMPLYSVVLRDITARLAAERALRDSEESLRLLFENNLDGLLLGDAVGHVARANPAALRLLGLHPARLQALGLEALRGPGNPLDACLAACGRTGQAKGDFTVVRAGGDTVHLEVAFAAYVDSGGQGRSSVLLHDVTERHAAQAAQAALSSQLRQSQKMEALGSIAGGIAHDFNNVIAAILGNARLAQANLPCQPAASNYLREISRAGLRARELVKRIMTFSRRQPAVFSRQPLGPVVREATALLRATLPSGVSITLHGDSAPVEVLADATQLHQVVMNLGTNAWQAMGQRGGRIDIRVELLPQSQQVRLSVQDDGAGMDAATQARIFEPFFTTKPDGEGTGLGLAVVQGIVQAHQGEISVSSTPGQGCRFDIVLPATPAAAADDGPPPREAEAAAAPLEPVLPPAGRHVVYVDDYEAMVAMVGAVLETQGLRVTGFDASPRALAWLREHAHEVDLLITDYNMPELSGLELVREARALRPDLPVILASGHITPQLRDAADEAGIACLFDKPAGIDELCLRIAQQLQQGPSVQDGTPAAR